MSRFLHAIAAGLVVLPLACATGLADPDAGDPGSDLPDSGPKVDGSLPAKDATPPPVADAGEPADAAMPPGDGGGPPNDAGSVGDGGLCSASGVLVTFDFTGEPGTQVSTAAKSTVAGVSSGAIGRAVLLKPNAGLNSINSNQWSPSVQIDLARYLSFVVTPDPKCKLDVTSISIDTKTSVLGPASAAIATSADNFVTLSKFTPGNGVSSVALAVAAATSAVEVRVYGYVAIDPSGTMRAQNTLTLSGTLK